MLAFVGTAISTVVIAIMMWLLGVMRISFRIDFFHATLFGAIISATDPVTVLAVFGRLNADKNLNALVFGESVLNDAVAIVLYQVIASFANNPVTFGGLMLGMWRFVYIFLGSLVIGVAVACIAAILFRTQYFRNEHAPVEAGLVIILAYSSFYITYGIGCVACISCLCPSLHMCMVCIFRFTFYDCHVLAGCLESCLSCFVEGSWPSMCAPTCPEAQMTG
jgi:NhaP-type Na+/H+ or K+/H+ antiporter